MRKRSITLMSVVITMVLGCILIGCGGKAKSSVKTGIIGAMDEEVDTLKQELENVKVTDIGWMEFYEGNLDGEDVVIVKCGIGKVNAGACAQVLITSFGVDRIINTGVAGSLDASIDIGDFVVSTDAVQHDFLMFLRAESAREISSSHQMSKKGI